MRYGNSMTETQAPEAQPKVKIRKKIDPPSDSPLARLLTAYHQAKDEAAAVDERAEEYLSQAKNLIFEAGGKDVPDAFDIVADPHGGYPAYSFAYTPPGWSVDSKRMKADSPETYVEWAKPTKGFWSFREKQNHKGGRK
jgi:hypothetical protein